MRLASYGPRASCLLMLAASLATAGCNLSFLEEDDIDDEPDSGPRPDAVVPDAGPVAAPGCGTHEMPLGLLGDTLAFDIAEDGTLFVAGESNGQRYLLRSRPPYDQTEPALALGDLDPRDLSAG